VWVARVSRPPVGVCADHIRFSDRDPEQIRPKLSAADPDWIEARFNVTLPADYRGFLLNHNGGVPDPNHIRIPGRPYSHDWPHEHVMGLGTVWAAAESNLDLDGFDVVSDLQALEKYRSDDNPDDNERERWRNEPHRHLMLIGSGVPEGELESVALGCGGAVVGRVYLVTPASWMMEDDAVDYVPVAHSFAEFLGMLTDYEPDHVKAIKAGDVAALRQWLDAGGNPDERYFGRALISYGASPVRLQCVRELLAHGTEVWGGLLQQARKTGCQELIDLLRSHWLLKDYDADHVQAIKTGDMAVLRRWLDAGGDPEQQYLQLSLLEHAMIHGNAEAARELLARGAGNWGGFELYARSSGSQELIDLLQAHGKPSRSRKRSS